jgi:3-phosphoshikimate 1-carboxyvinyltransferase
MDFLAIPPVRSLSGSIRVPPSKSATNRALVAAALGPSAVEIVRPLESEDTASLRRCLVAMGATIQATPEGLRVSGPLRGGEAEVTLNAGDSGTAARFLIAAAAAVPGRFLLTGSPRLCQRPMGELVDALRSGGAHIDYRGAEGVLPVAVRGGSLRSGVLEVDASRSSQFLSAILLAGLAVEGGLGVRAVGAVASAPYVSTTIETLRALGHEADEGGILRVAQGASPAARFATPGDYSSAISLLAAVGAASGTLSLTGLRWPSGDADAGALPVLERMGLCVEAFPAAMALEASASGAVRPVATRATDFPDAVPALAALAALADGESRFSGVGPLRWKESHRLEALAAVVTAAGARARADEDTLTVEGPVRSLGGVRRLPTFRDHRMVMAGAVLAVATPGLLVEDPGCVAKSYPFFFRDLESVARR